MHLRIILVFIFSNWNSKMKIQVKKQQHKKSKVKWFCRRWRRRKTPPRLDLQAEEEMELGSQVSAWNESTNGVGQVAEAEGVVDVVRVVGVQQVLLGYEVGDEDLLDQEVNQRLLVFLGGKFTLGLSYILSSYESWIPDLLQFTCPLIAS